MNHGQGYVQELGRLHQRMYRSFHATPFARRPVRLGVLRCSDGRMRAFNRAVNAPPGLLFDMRSVGAKKDFISYPFRDRLNDWLRQDGRHYVFLLTYHFDCMEKELGCRGHDFESEQAIQFQKRLARDIQEGFRGQILPLVVGFDTRLEELVLHGKDEAMRTRQLGDMSQVGSKLNHLWPQATDEVLSELAPMLLYNASHVGENVANGYQDRLKNHEEVGVVIGRRIGWVVDEDDALQVVMIEDTSIAPAAEMSLGISLLKSNLMSGRISREQGVFIFVCIPYLERHREKEASVVAAKRWAELAYDIVHQQAPEIVSSLVFIVGVISEETRQISLIEGPDGCLQNFESPVCCHKNQPVQNLLFGF